MKHFYALVLGLFSLTSLSIFAQEEKAPQVLKRRNAAGAEETWILTFNDEFNGQTLDLEKWKPVEGVPRDPYQNSARVWYSPENVEVSNGHLKLNIKNDTLIDEPFSVWITDRMVPLKATVYFTSAEIEAKEATHFGMYEMRVRIPKSRGFNSAFWLYGAPTGPNNEIDIFEYWDVKGPLSLAYSARRTCRWHNMTAHYNGGMTIEGYLGEDISEGFHTFTCVWDECRIEWWVDGDLKRTLYKYEGMRGNNADCGSYLEKKKGKKVKETAFPREPMKIIANVAVKKDPGGPDQLNLFPLAMEIDYIRYYQKAQR